MNCQGLRTLYLKANGDMPCEDDMGEQVVLAQIGHAGRVDLEAILDNERYRHLLTSVVLGKNAWPLVCERCAFLRREESPDPRLWRRSIEKIQIETTLACALRCDGCSGFSQIKSRPGHHVLPVAVHRALLEACAARGYVVDWVEYCGQGEPLNHPRFPEFLTTTRATLPATRQRVITNGNHNFDQKLPGNLPDELFVSCDGATATTCGKYRVGGRFDTVIRFMERAVARRAQNHDCRIVWKYILFEHNDSDDELILAQRTAENIGVDQLLFCRNPLDQQV